VGDAPVPLDEIHERDDDDHHPAKAAQEEETPEEQPIEDFLRIFEA
jgi:hypothetical protein